MRRAAALSVLLAAGCNAVFGLDPATSNVDAAADDGAGSDYLLVVEDRIGPSCPIRVEP